MNQPMVSICIPTYNGVAFLKQCVDSCMVQTYRDIEIIVNDDCSSDGTLALAKELAAIDHRIKVIANEKNLGLVGNWNATMSKASGKYIKMLFQDDWMEPHCIEEMLSTAERFPDQLIVSKRSYVFEKGTSAEVMHYYNNEVRVLPVKHPGAVTEFSSGEIVNLFAAQPGMNFIGEPSLYFFSRSLFEQAGVFDDQLLQVCDLDFALRCANYSGLVYIDKKLNHFTVHASSTTSKNVSVHYFRLRFFEVPVLINKLKKMQGKLFDAPGLKEKLRLYFYIKLRAFEAASAVANNTSLGALYQELLGKYPFMKIKRWERVFLFPLSLLAGKRIKREGIEK